MKMSRILSLVLVVVMVLATFASCGIFGGGNQGGDKTVIKIWVSEISGPNMSAVELAETQIAEFLEANPEYKETYKFEVSGMSEGDAASQVLTDVALAPDLYCFAQDQLARLVQANALAVPGQQATANIKAANDAISVSAASVAGTLYAYPLTSDNGYYMYYDKSVVTNPDDLAQIVADCEDADKNICFELENAWYTASFFMATGCVSNWTMNTEGKFTSVEDDWNSEKGIAAMKGMQIVTKSPNYVNSSSEFANAGIVVTGIWNANTAVATLGENFGVADLPSFTVDGESYHLASFSGNKLMGVKPQADADKLSMLHKLAQYLTGAECQLDRYNELQWGPSNLEAQGNADVKANVSLAALAEQNKYAQPQGNIHGSWWDIAKLLGGESKLANNEDDIQKALDTYKTTIDGLFQKSEEELKAWSVIGSMNGDSWKVDLPMTKQAAQEGGKDVYLSEAIVFAVGDQFKLRQGGGWTVNFGSDGEIDGSNFAMGNSVGEVLETNDDGTPKTVATHVAGKYTVKLLWNEGDTTATIELIPAN